MNYIHFKALCSFAKTMYMRSVAMDVCVGKQICMYVHVGTLSVAMDVCVGKQICMYVCTCRYPQCYHGCVWC